MSRIVSVESGLHDIKTHLTVCGYQVVDMAENVRPVEVVIYQGLDERNENSGKTCKGTAVINAAGMTAEEVVAYLNEVL